MLTARKSTSWNGTVTWSIQNNPPWTGIAWAEPYTFPPIDATSYAPASGSLGPTYQVVGFSDDYRASSSASSLNHLSNLVIAAGGVTGCGGLQPSNYDGNYGTYYAGAIYAAQAALLAEQANNPGSTNVMVILGDGNSTAPRSSSSPNPLSPGMPSSATESTTTYKSTTQLTNAAYSLPATYGVATNSGTYPSWVGECGQAIDAAHYAANIPQNGTKVFTIAYGASTRSSGSACASDLNAGQHPNISPLRHHEADGQRSKILLLRLHRPRRRQRLRLLPQRRHLHVRDLRGYPLAVGPRRAHSQQHAVASEPAVPPALRTVVAGSSCSHALLIVSLDNSSSASKQFSWPGSNTGTTYPMAR